MCYFRIWDIETGECEGIIQDEEYFTGWGYVSSFFFYWAYLSDSDFSIHLQVERKVSRDRVWRSGQGLGLASVDRFPKWRLSSVPFNDFTGNWFWSNQLHFIEFLNIFVWWQIAEGLEIGLLNITVDDFHIVGTLNLEPPQIIIRDFMPRTPWSVRLSVLKKVIVRVRVVPMCCNHVPGQRPSLDQWWTDYRPTRCHPDRQRRLLSPAFTKRDLLVYDLFSRIMEQVNVLLDFFLIIELNLKIYPFKATGNYFKIYSILESLSSVRIHFSYFLCSLNFFYRIKIKEHSINKLSRFL